MTSESVVPVIQHPQERLALFEAKEKLKGGVGDGAKDSDFDANELAMGIEIEKEHTKDERVATEIARDHLSEIPDYYTRLKKMEKQASVKEESTSWRLDNKPLHKKQHTNDINVIVVMMPDDEYSKKKQEASDIVLRKEAIELCSMDAEEVYGVFPNDEWDDAMKIAKGLIEEVDQARMERDNEDQEN